ncbi:MAG: glucokinase [Micromonosporaceae bacterium]|nr:glucokinase [Micromonosporaceae bacterium]
MADDVVVALDVGGTGIKCALVDEAGRVRHGERHATGRERGPDAVVATILDIAGGLVRTAGTRGLRPRAVGVVVPGVIDEDAGVAVWAANVGFRDVPLRQLVVDRLGLPATLGHDVRAGGLAEARLGAGRGYRHVLVVAIGTGIAAAHVVDGRVFAGAHGAAGEIGHIVVRPGGPACGCGLRGCLEAIASASAVARRYAEAIDAASTATSRYADARPGEPIGADRVAALAADGDPIAAAIWQETIDALADGLVTGIALFDPEVVVIGGGLAEAGDSLLVPLTAALRSRLTFHREPALFRAALGDEAGCLGAGLIALDTLQRIREPSALPSAEEAV